MILISKTHKSKNTKVTGFSDWDRFFQISREFLKLMETFGNGEVTRLAPLFRNTVYVFFLGFDIPEMSHFVLNLIKLTINENIPVKNLALILNSSCVENWDKKPRFSIFLRRQIALGWDLSETSTRVPTCRISRFISFFSSVTTYLMQKIIEKKNHARVGMTTISLLSRLRKYTSSYLAEIFGLFEENFPPTQTFFTDKTLSES